MAITSTTIIRRPTRQVRIGHVLMGGDAPIVVQSMTNTDTADIQGTIDQVFALANAGSELVRITVNSPEAAAAVAAIRDGLDTLHSLTATSCCVTIPTAPRRWQSTVSIQATSVAATNMTRNLRK